jgi:hypothetical protein
MNKKKFNETQEMRRHNDLTGFQISTFKMKRASVRCLSKPLDMLFLPLSKHHHKDVIEHHAQDVPDRDERGFGLHEDKKHRITEPPRGLFPDPQRHRPSTFASPRYCSMLRGPSCEQAL